MYHLQSYKKTFNFSSINEGNISPNLAANYFSFVDIESLKWKEKNAMGTYLLKYLLEKLGIFASNLF